MSALPATVTLLFDGCCGFCTRSVGWLERLDRKGRVTIVPYQHPGAPEAHGLTLEQCEQAARAVAPDGRCCSGAAAMNIAAAVALGNPLPVWLYERPPMRRLQDGLYRWVARNRRRLPGVTPFCLQQPEACACS
ncbi:MAG: thiol-disulfide oxidoreductase DCC family protein [Egibacteraceae bacterium]